MTFSYYPGCTLRTKAIELDRCARAAAEVLGVTLEEVPEWQCCGGVYPMAKDEIATKLSSVRTLVAARDAGHDLVTICSACHNVIKQVNQDMASDEDICTKANNYMALETPYHGETKVYHYLELLRDVVGFDKIKEKVVVPFTGKKIGAYYGCLLLRPGRVMQMDNPENPNCNLQIKFTYPVSVENDLLADIQKQFVLAYFGEAYENLSPKDAVEKYQNDYLAAYKELEPDYEEELKRAEDGTPVGAWFSYYELSSNQIQFNQNDLISFTVNFENYTGGAHGAHAYNHFVIDLKNGKKLKEEDIFIDSYQEQLAAILVAQIAKQNNVTDPKELENMGFFSVDEIYPNNNFLIDETGITYTFNEYEIAAYVVGPIHVHIPFEDVQLLLKQESPIASLAGL